MFSEDVDFIIGDINLLRTAIAALKTSAWRRAALERHIWRPSRFLSLLERFASPQSENRAAQELAPIQAQIMGLRTLDSIAEHAEILSNDAKTPPISQEEKETYQEFARP